MGCCSGTRRAPKTLGELAGLAGIHVEVVELHDFKEKDFEDLTVELGVAGPVDRVGRGAPGRSSTPQRGV